MGDNLYVISDGTKVLRYDGGSGKFIDEFVFTASGGMAGGQTLLFGPGGKLYVTSFSTNNVLRYDGTTGSFVDAFADYDSLTDVYLTDHGESLGLLNRNPTVRRHVYVTCIRIGRVQQQFRRFKKAEDAYREAISILETLMVDFPKVGLYPIDLAHLHRRLGHLLHTTGQPEKARAPYHQCLST